MSDIPADVIFIPAWRSGTELLDALHTLFTPTEEADFYGAWLHRTDQDVQWPEVFAESGPQLLSDLKNDTGITFTVAFFHAYMNGSSCGWHRDLAWDGQAILSLGITRTFGLRHDDGTEYLFPMEHGDLLVMPSGFQHNWEHNLIQEEVQGERCSIVFRSPA